MHDVVIVGIPLIAILAGILFNRSDIKDLRAEMRSEIGDLRSEMGGLRTELHTESIGIRGELRDFRSEVLSRLNVIESDMRQFYHLTAS
jgi:hypothetical protein